MKNIVKPLSVALTIIAIVASCTKNPSQPPVSEDENAIPLIDLGLPSGVKWAACNLGANNPKEYGDFYQWAGIEDVNDISTYLDFSNCPYHIVPEIESGWTKYIPSDRPQYWSGTGGPDNKIVLDPEDDAAHVKWGDNWGGKWRLPTIEDFKELIENCTSKWVTMYGLEGTKFTSKENGNSIFLPAAGFRYRDGIRFTENGYYWSSSINKDLPEDARDIVINSDGVMISSDFRYYGLLIRPVSD